MTNRNFIQMVAGLETIECFQYRHLPFHFIQIFLTASLQIELCKELDGRSYNALLIIYLMRRVIQTILYKHITCLYKIVPQIRVFFLHSGFFQALQSQPNRNAYCIKAITKLLEHRFQSLIAISHKLFVASHFIHLKIEFCHPHIIIPTIAILLVYTRIGYVIIRLQFPTYKISVPQKRLL